MYCVCQNNSTNELSIMTRAERERLVSVLIDLCEPIPTWVINVFERIEDAEKYVSDLNKSNKLIDGL